MADSSRESWSATTHSWAASVDRGHLEEARRLVGAVGPNELAHMILEIVAYADDEAEDQNRLGTVVIEIASDNLTVTDDGRGTDTRRDSDGIVVRKPVMATCDIRFFARADAPLLPDGERRRGMSVVAANCAELIHENRRREGAWAQRYERGVPVSDLVEIGTWTGTGTTVRLGRLDRAVIAGLDLPTLGSYLRDFTHVEVTVKHR